MPLTCIVLNCGSRADRDKVSFYRIPTALQFKHKVKLNELSKKRRQKWLAAIKRSDLTELKIKTQKVCSKHFTTGKPADLEDVDHPDWIPSRQLGYTILGCSSKSETSLHRYERAGTRKKIITEAHTPGSLLGMECGKPDESAETDVSIDTAATGVSTQTELV